ncbi:gpr1-like plasma membrane protein [Talaromyces proteolyticus]|uniref:Gpr1-like plasma membrane protein n=1 Tax=Talaromyces proteolyticus TaxID=1131652 RepID=A0AAD4Q287_9EURO|nr:gpr1-like plasma membrane protein [Talaromyces proteolyticus]KAH8700207.1 gpr1-like plasma membrane protein [Talaromyces proteolyticus]
MRDEFLIKDESSRLENTITRDESKGAGMHGLTSVPSIALPPEIFEKLYLSPQNKVKGELRRTFGNPTPLQALTNHRGLVGFCIALTPLSCDLMGWRGSGGGGAADVGAYYWFGGLLQILACVLEFFIGNTFTFVVFGSFGAFFLSFATTLVPFYNAAGAYTTAQMDGADSPQYHASFGFFPLFMGLLCVFYLICALRTNIIFVIIFLALVISLGLLTAVHWQAAIGSALLAARLQKAAGAAAFVTTILGWYLLLSQLLASVDFAFQLPVGDLSTLFRGRSEKAQAGNYQEGNQV